MGEKQMGKTASRWKWARLHNGRLYLRQVRKTPAGLTAPQTWRTRRTKLKCGDTSERQYQSNDRTGGRTRRAPLAHLDKHTHTMHQYYMKGDAMSLLSQHFWTPRTTRAFPVISSSDALLLVNTSRNWRRHGRFRNDVKSESLCWYSSGTCVNPLSVEQETRFRGRNQVRGGNNMHNLPEQWIWTLLFSCWLPPNKTNSHTQKVFFLTRERSL